MVESQSRRGVRGEIEKAVTVNQKTKDKIDDECRKKEWREMWEQAGRLGGFDPTFMMNLPEFGR